MTTLSYQQLVADHHIAHWHLEMWTAWAFCGLFNALTLEPAMSTSAALLVEGSEKATQSTLIHDWYNHRDQKWSRRNVAQVVSFKANPALDIFNKTFELSNCHTMLLCSTEPIKILQIMLSLDAFKGKTTEMILLCVSTVFINHIVSKVLVSNDLGIIWNAWERSSTHIRKCCNWKFLSKFAFEFS